MQLRFHHLWLNLIYGFGYFAGGYIGMLLATPPSNASPVWPAAGLALAGLIRHGWKIMPGLYLGALAAQIYSFLDASTEANVWLSILIGSAVAVFSCLQAWVGFYLIRRVVGTHDPLLEDKKILHFLIIGGPVSCVVAATLGIALLYVGDILLAEDVWIGWGTWWIGDTIGVIIFTPLILLYTTKPESFWKARRHLISYPLLMLLLIVVAVFKYSQNQEEDRIKREFDRQVARLHGRLSDEISKHIAVNQILKAFFDSSERVRREEFRQFTRPLIAQVNSIQALEWIPKITHAERLRLQGKESFTIREPDANRTMVAADTREAYFAIRYIEPAPGNERALGFDINTNPQVKQVLNRVIESGRTSATEDIQLIQDKDRHDGIVLYSPVYQKRHQLETAGLRRQYFLGFVASVFRVGQVATGIMGQITDVELNMTITDGDRRMFSTDANGQQYKINYLGLRRVLPVDLSGRTWMVHYQPSPAFFARQQSWATWWLLLGGMMLSCLIGMGLLLLIGRAARVEELVRVKTNDLETLNRHLNQEMAKRQKLQVEQGSRNKVLEQLAQGDKLENILNRIALDAQRQQPDMLCSILLFDVDKQRLYLGAAPSLPDFYNQAIDGLLIGEGVGCCGTAVYRKETVIAEDILNHPFWHDFHDLVLRTELRACWSEPIISSKNTVLGSFAIYYRKPYMPTRDDIRFIKRMAQLSGIAIEQKINESELRIAATTFQSHEAIMVTDRNGTILRVNQAFSRITGYSASEAVGQNPRMLSSRQHPRRFYQQLFKTLLRKGRWQGEIWNRRKNGETYPEWLMVTAVKNDRDEVSHYVAIFSDITEKKAAEKEIHDLAFYDPLTGLPNRRLLLDRLQHEIIAAKRHGRFGALFFLDLDHFKRLNDSLGHQVGDELLIQVAQRINTLLREEDTACRLGGDEFIVLVTGQGNSLDQATDHAALLGERIRDIINQSFMLQGSSHHFTTSIGISIFPDITDQPEAIIQQADTAMYRAKEHGRNSICFFRPSMQKLADQRLILEKEMREALRDDHFMLFYQPQVDQNGGLVSVEALIRWCNPEKGMISPADFIPVAEDTQLILPIGQWVLHEACRQIRRWDGENHPIGHVAVNVSSRQFRQADFVDQVKSALSEAEIDASRLMIELTEGVVIDNIEDTVNKMRALKSMGVGISIDDFGTGYSSLSYLKQLPISQLKIDQNFVRDIVSDPNDAIIVETIINMAQNLDLNVIAEGVETQAQMDFLLIKGCRHFQGYFFGRPAKAAEICLDRVGK